MIAAKLGHEVVCKVLLENGAQVNAANQHEVTALMTAVDQGLEAICELLLTKCARIDIADQDGGTTLITLAKQGHLEVGECQKSPIHATHYKVAMYLKR
jgi:ankyrin repeat protein